MSPRTLRSFRHLEGHHVSVALADGTRLDDCELVSAGRGAAASIWLHDGLDDRIVEAADILDVWELA